MRVYSLFLLVMSLIPATIHVLNPKSSEATDGLFMLIPLLVGILGVMTWNTLRKQDQRITEIEKKLKDFERISPK